MEAFETISILKEQGSEAEGIGSIKCLLPNKRQGRSGRRAQSNPGRKRNSVVDPGHVLGRFGKDL